MARLFFVAQIVNLRFPHVTDVLTQINNLRYKKNG
jgi:hypothetical protein